MSTSSFLFLQQHNWSSQLVHNKYSNSNQENIQIIKLQKSYHEKKTNQDKNRTIQIANPNSPRFTELKKQKKGYLGSYSNTSASLFPFLSFHCTFRRVFSQFLDMPPLRGGNKELESLSHFQKHEHSPFHKTIKKINKTTDYIQILFQTKLEIRLVSPMLTIH